jgi:Zn2+/Cd2+-exporting ATPase
MIDYPQPEKFEEYSGKGMTAVYRNELIVTGKLAFLQKMGIKITQEEIDMANKQTAEGLNVTMVGYNNNLIGFLVLEDELRPKLKETIKELKDLGVKKTVMLTGDNQEVAKKTSEILGIDEFHANLLPEDKINYLKTYLNKKSKVAMVGDGVNDAPILAMSDIGIAMGAVGSDAAIEAADIAMMKDDLSQLPELIKIGRTAINVIRENIGMWAVINVIGLALVFLRVLNPAEAAFWNFATDFIPIINSLRLFK